MIQSLKLLQVNTLQLEQLLKTEIEMNPVLDAVEEMEQKEEEPQEKDEKSDEEEQELEVKEDEIDWEEYLEEGFDLGYSKSEEYEHDRDRYEPTAVHQASLEEHLSNQLAEKKIPERQRLLAQFLIGSLDADGYLRVSIDHIAEFTQTTEFEIEEALNVIWNMEPAGLGARSLKECLSLQLARRGLHDSLALKIITEQWDLFEKVKIRDIARNLNVDPVDVQNALEEVKKLNPKPGYLVVPEKSSPIVPDLIVDKMDGKFVVFINDRSIPSLHVNRAYADMLKRGSTVKKEVKNYIREKFNSATWLIRSIEQRKSTMLKVMYAIIERQPEFFEKGPPNLNPLKLQDIADMIEMHISTVSRVTSNKYVQTLHGIFELKYFFTEAVGQKQGGSDISTMRIKTRLKELVEEEDTKKPLSDQKLSEILTREGLNVARRTVAKYREQASILPARLRQRYD